MSPRLLAPTEVSEARLVYGGGLDYARVRVWEGTRLPNFVADIGAALRRQRRTWNNALSLGNVCLFPARLDTSAEALAAGRLDDMAWLIHELAHQWQYQRLGWLYLFRALRTQLRLGPDSYHYHRGYATPADALLAAQAAGRRLADFNLEQQGDLARHYYLVKKTGRDASAWEPFVAEFQITQ